MKNYRYGPAVVFLTSAVVLGTHLVLNGVFKSHSDAISFVFFILLSLSALCACVGRALRCAPTVRRGYLLVAFGLLLWFSATLMAAYAQLFQHASNSLAAIDDFFYFYYGVPILLAIAAPEETQLLPVFFWLDGIQAAAVGFLAFVALFAVLPFSGEPMHPMTVAHLIWIYDTEHTLLAVLATVRLLMCPRRSPQRRFFEILVAYLWVYGICASVYNHIVAVYTDAGMLDVIVDLPFVVLILALLIAPFATIKEAEPRRRRPVASFMDNALPVMLGLALVVLCVLVAREHFKIAMGTILGAFVVYGARSAILHSSYARSQAALEEARDRLADLAMQDGLTGIANRRCFDQRLRSEWRRAQRSRAPLSLLLIDIDHFKRLNDTYGHMTGDECLIQVAQTLRGGVNRPGDLLARYGGEEFVALLPETGAIGARNVAARLRTGLSRTAPIAGVPRQVNVSIGATTWDGQDGSSAEMLMETADRALYQAKQNGRDRVEFLELPSSVAS